MAGHSFYRYRLFRRFFLKSLLLVLGFLCFAGQANSLLAAKEEQVELPWSRLGEILGGKKVMVAMTDGAIVEGRVLQVGSNELLVDINKTSDSRKYARGQNSIQRPQVSVIRLPRVKGNWRALGTAIGVGATAVAGALIYTYFENEANPERGAAVAAGLIAGGGVAGYFLGREADRRVLIITISP